MRELADKDRIEAFTSALAKAATAETDVFLVGGTSAVLIGWRTTTMDVDLVMRPESDAMLRAIPALKERLQINVELASPDQFVPVPAGWEARSPFIVRIGLVTFRHYDFVAQALAKIERGHTRDLADVDAQTAGRAGQRSTGLPLGMAAGGRWSETDPGEPDLSGGPRRHPTGTERPRHHQRHPGHDLRPGSSGGPCFDKTFTLFGLHQGAWPGDEINRGVPITQVCSDIESTGGLPAPEPSDLFVWKTLELEAPVIGCDAFQTLIWNSALSGTPQLIPIPASSAGGAGSGKSFRLTVLSEMLPAAGHLKIPLKASELGGAGGEADAMRVVAAICKTAGAPQPPIMALADYNAPVDSWLKDEVVPKLIGALDSARVSRLVWISIEDLNKFKLEGAISNLLLFLYEQLTPIRWLRIVLDGMRGDIPKSLRQITANPAPAVEVISEADITDYLRRAMAEIKPPGADTLRLAVKGAKRIYDKARGNEPETAAGELVDWLRDTLRDYEGDVEGSQ